MDISGIKLININTITIIAKNGNKGLITCVTKTFATSLLIKSSVPTGGVQIPIHKFNTITIPK